MTRKTTCRIFAIVLVSFLLIGVLTATSHASNMVIVTEVIPTQIEFNKVKSMEKGTSGGGAVVGGIAGAGTALLYAVSPPLAIIGAAGGALVGNKLEKDIMDKKVTTDSRKATVPGFYVKLSNGQYYLTTTRFQKGQRISIETFEND